MLYEIIGPDGKRKMYTEYRECLPSKDQLKQMIKAGYKILVDGKRAKKEMIGL